MSLDEKSVVKHFEDTHAREELGRFLITPLPRKANVIPLGESHSKAAKRFRNLERSLAGKASSPKLIEAMHEYFEMVLSWLQGNPRQFKTFVGNRVSDIMDLVSPCRWHHVIGSSNPTDCASRGLFPKELIQHNEWWNVPKRLYKNGSHWPSELVLTEHPEPTEARVTPGYSSDIDSVRITIAKLGL